VAGKLHILNKSAVHYVSFSVLKQLAHFLRTVEWKVNFIF